MMLLSTLLLAAVVQLTIGQHDHEEHWEWAGVFRASEIGFRHTLLLKKSMEMEDNLTITVFVTSSPSGDASGLEEAEEVAEEMFETQAPLIAEGPWIELGTDTVYSVTMSNES